MVGDQEVVYRRVRLEWARYVDGQWRLTSQAFNDQKRKPSVDRKDLRDNPEDSKLDATDGIAQLLTSEVRATSAVIQNPLAPTAQQIPYRLDVIPRPIPANNPEGLPENLAHAQIESDPMVDTRTRFDKIKEALVRLAMNRDWVIEPRPPV